MTRIKSENLTSRQREVLKRIGSVGMASVPDQSTLKICKVLKLYGLVAIQEKDTDEPADVWLTLEGQAIVKELLDQ